MVRDPDLLFVDPCHLVRHIRKLHSWGYELVTFGELAHALREGTGAGRAALTFDDGFVDNLRELPAILAGEQARATVFVPSGWLGQSHPSAPWTRVMTDSEVVELSRAGVEIGCHTHSHPDLSTLTREQALEEFTTAKGILEELLDRPVETAAYPFGRTSVTARAACRDAGLLAACRTCGEGTFSDPYDIPRQDMTNGSSMTGLRLKRVGRYENLMRRLPFRAARSARRRALELRR